jgi:glycosyltransferase involved in cell wall biosynthesis
MTAQPPLVSVLITAYNRQQYIRQAISSVLASTYQHIEVIVCDDASTDDTLAIARQIAQMDARVTVLANQQNLGDYANRNKAAAAATGKYLKYLDSDDYIYPHSIAILVAYMEQHPDAGYAFCDNAVQDNEQPFPVQYGPAEAFKKHFLQDGLFYAGPGGTIIRRSVFVQVQGFSGKRFFGDTELLMKIALLHPVLKVQPALIWWRIHQEQEAAQERKQPVIIAERYRLMSSFLQQSPLSPAEKKKAQLVLDKLMARNIWRYGIAAMHIGNTRAMLHAAGFSVTDLRKAFYIKNKVKKMLGTAS